MNSYPNPGDPNQPNQYPPNQTQTQYGGGYQTPPNASSSGYGEQPPYQQQQQQQGAYQQPPYQAPYQQPPYQQTPYPQRQSTIAFDWRYLTAGIGALVALIAFFLPSYSALIELGGENGNLGSLGSLFGSVIPQISGAQFGRWLWLEVIIALVPLVIAALLQFHDQIFKAPASPNMQKLGNSLSTQTRTWGLVLVAVGAFGFFFHVILGLGIISLWGIGAWLYALGIIAIIIGGFFVYRPPASTPAGVPPVR